jgi:hypothetical protein
MEVIGITFFILLILAFVIFLIKEQIENIRYKKSTMQVYLSEWETKIIDKKDYHKYEDKDKEIRANHKSYNEWFDSLDNDRHTVYHMERIGFYYKAGLRGKYINDYIKGKIDKDEFDRKHNEELESDEYKKRLMKKRDNYEKIKEEKSEIKKEIDEKSKELEELHKKYYDI